MPSSPPVLSELGEALCFLFILLIPLAVTGLALLNCGLGKAHSAAHSMLAALGATGVASIVYVAIGYAWQGYIGDASHVFHAAGKPVNWLGAAPFFLQGFDLEWREVTGACRAGAERWRSCDDSCGRGSRSLAIERDSVVSGRDGGVGLSAIRALDLGGWMARAIGDKLRTWPRLHGRGGSKFDSCGGWIDGARSGVDPGTSPRQILARGNADGNSGTQYGSRPAGLFPGASRVVRTELCRSDAV